MIRFQMFSHISIFQYFNISSIFGIPSSRFSRFTSLPCYDNFATLDNISCLSRYKEVRYFLMRSRQTIKLTLSH